MSHVTCHMSHVTCHPSATPLIATAVVNPSCRYCYHGCARARIFARELAARNVTLPRMQAIMRLNNWQHDPLSGGDPGAQVSARYDLDVKDAWCGGAIDAKVGNGCVTCGHSCVACGAVHVCVLRWVLWRGC